MNEPETAVVIEDEQDIRDLISVILTKAGFVVHTAATGAAGLAIVRAHRPSVVTVDVGLPDIDGLEVTRGIREFSDAFIVLLTARSDELDVLRGLETGADEYLTKPFRPKELRERIARGFNRANPDIPAGR
ncbi:response regulator [Paenarthrobacter sp. PH39-S1]|uniref:response regulator transcription factor n=1 Tax=Paenarthrobacter sp. PH39-S1 TaxID=3046204 RepID=UPI0032D91166